MSKDEETTRERSLRLLKTLTETDGAPGHEQAVKVCHSEGTARYRHSF